MILLSSQVEKYKGDISMTIDSPFFAWFNITLAIGPSRLPRYFIRFFSHIKTVKSRSSFNDVLAFPRTPLYGIVGLSTQKYTLLLFFMFSIFLENL